MITKEIIDNLPSYIGVYLFKNKKQIIYIGKSVNIKARVRSHFENAKFDKKEELIIKNADFIETIVLENEFQALVLESELIKKYHPKYNVLWKDDKSYLYIKITIKDEYPKVLLSRKENDGKSLYFGPFSSTKIAQSLINDIRHFIPFCTEKKLSKSPCFYSKINLCQPCPNYINTISDENFKKQLKKTYLKNINKVIKILKGKVVEILNNFYKDLNYLIKKENYEKAIELRNKIFRLERLINHPLKNSQSDFYQYFKKEDSLILLFQELKKFFPKLKKLERIEGYDISNLREDYQVGSMVVFCQGKLDKKQYRRFRLKNKNSDFERLEEVFQRRFKNNWPKPDLIVVDGGKPQVKIVIKTIKNIALDIPVIGIAKNPDRLIIGIKNLPTIRFPQTNPSFNIIRLIRDESHRFAKKYHLFLRQKDFLI